MKYNKLQSDILKDAINRDSKCKNFKWMYGQSDDAVFVSDGFMLIRIPNDKWYLDINRVFQERNEIKSITAMLDNAAIADQAERTGNLIRLDKRTVEVFETENNPIWVDTKYLTYFEGDGFRGTTSVKPLYIYEFNTCVGLVLPAQQSVKKQC